MGFSAVRDEMTLTKPLGRLPCFPRACRDDGKVPVNGVDLRCRSHREKAFKIAVQVSRYREILWEVQEPDFKLPTKQLSSKSAKAVRRKV